MTAEPGGTPAPTWEGLFGAAPGIDLTGEDAYRWPSALTDAEQQVIRQAGDLWNAICAAVPEGPARANDLGELVGHIHAIQHAFMANAAARAYPHLYRVLGESGSSEPRG